MKVEFDKKDNVVKFIPESDFDVYNLGRAVQSFNGGFGGFEFVNRKMSFVSFRAMDMLNRITDKDILNRRKDAGHQDKS